jgi:Domain of unknown function (DUF4184)
MPFTAAHPAIILPFIRSRYFSATGLIVGSLAPDFEYFFKMAVSSNYSHTLGGLFYFDLPVTLVIALVFHIIVKKNLIYNLPGFFQRRFQGLLNFDFVTYLKGHQRAFLLSALLGSASHIFWDSFTHNNSFFAQTIPFYKGTYVPYDGVKYPLFYALQHISTWIGLTIVGIYVIALRPVSIQYQSTQKFLYWFTLVTITVIVTWTRFVIVPLDSNIGNLIVTAISGFLLSLVCCGLINFKNTTLPQQSLNG